MVFPALMHRSHLRIVDLSIGRVLRWSHSAFEQIDELFVATIVLFYVRRKVVVLGAMVIRMLWLVARGILTVWPRLVAIVVVHMLDVVCSMVLRVLMVLAVLVMMYFVRRRLMWWMLSWMGILRGHKRSVNVSIFLSASTIAIVCLDVFYVEMSAPWIDWERCLFEARPSDVWSIAEVIWWWWLSKNIVSLPEKYYKNIVWKSVQVSKLTCFSYSLNIHVFESNYKN